MEYGGQGLQCGTQFFIDWNLNGFCDQNPVSVFNFVNDCGLNDTLQDGTPFVLCPCNNVTPSGCPCAIGFCSGPNGLKSWNDWSILWFGGPRATPDGGGGSTNGTLCF